MIPVDLHSVVESIEDLPTRATAGLNFSFCLALRVTAIVKAEDDP